MGEIEVATTFPPIYGYLPRVRPFVKSADVYIKKCINVLNKLKN